MYNIGPSVQYWYTRFRLPHWNKYKKKKKKRKKRKQHSESSYLTPSRWNGIKELTRTESTCDRSAWGIKGLSAFSVLPNTCRITLGRGSTCTPGRRPLTAFTEQSHPRKLYLNIMHEALFLGLSNGQNGLKCSHFKYTMCLPQKIWSPNVMEGGDFVVFIWHAAKLYHFICFTITETKSTINTLNAVSDIFDRNRS